MTSAAGSEGQHKIKEIIILTEKEKDMALAKGMAVASGIGFTIGVSLAIARYYKRALVVLVSSGVVFVAGWWAQKLAKQGSDA